MTLNLILNIIFIITIITVIWDISGFMNDLTKFIYEKTHPDKLWMGQQLPKIISCSYCIKFHTVWIYLIIFNSIPIIIGLFIACISTFFGIFIKKILLKLTDKLNRYE